MTTALRAHRAFVRVLVLAVLVIGAVVASAAPAVASGPIIIDNFTAGSGSWSACGNSTFVYYQAPSIIGGARELEMRDGGSCHFGPYPAQMKIDSTQGTAEWYGNHTYAPEQVFSYGTEIGTHDYPWSPSPNKGKGTPLHLSLTLNDEILVQMVQVQNPFLAIRLRDGNGNTYSLGVSLAVGANLIPLSGFSGLTAAAAANINGISFQGSSNTSPGDVVSLFAIQPGDTTPPVAAPAQTPAANSNGWNNSDVTVNWNWTDSGSGIDASNCTQSSTSAGEGAITLTSTCQDVAGNQASDSVTVNVDKTAPTIVATATTAPNANGWYSGDVTVHFTCSDGGSGIPAGACPADQVLTGEGAAISSTAETVTDAAGNTSAPSNVVTVQIDSTAPTVTFSPNGQTYDVNDTVSITCSASDALSGVASSTCADVSGSAWSFGLGTHSLSATATDNAGNVGSGSGSFTVRATAGGVCALVQQWVSKAGVANSLCAKLQAAAASRARGNNQAADNQLEAFRNELDAQTGKSISADRAATLAQLSYAL